MTAGRHRSTAAPGVGVECPLDDIGEVALEDAEGGLAGLADGLGAVFQEGRWRVRGSGPG